MNRKELKFMIAFAEVYGLMHHTVEYVYNGLQRMFKDLGSPEEYMDCFMEKYNAMKEYHLDDEIISAVAKGEGFFNACEEWDI